MPEAPGPPGLITQRPDALRRGGGRMAQHRDRAGAALRGRVVERHLHARALQRGVRVDLAVLLRGGERRAGAPGELLAVEAPRARAGRSPRGRAPRQPRDDLRAPPEQDGGDPHHGRRRGPSDDGGAGSRWIARRSPCHGPRDRPVTGVPERHRPGVRRPTVRLVPAGGRGRRGGASVGPANLPDDPGTRRARWASRQGRTTMTSPGSHSPQRRRTRVHHLQEMKARGERWPMLTAYDVNTARIFDEAGVPVLLVGDSAGNTVLGYDTTVPGDHRGAADPHPGRGARRAARPRRRRPPLRQLPGLGRAGRRPPPSSS